MSYVMGAPNADTFKVPFLIVNPSNLSAPFLWTKDSISEENAKTGNKILWRALYTSALIALEGTH